MKNYFVLITILITSVGYSQCDVHSYVDDKLVKSYHKDHGASLSININVMKSTEKESDNPGWGPRNLMEFRDHYCSRSAYLTIKMSKYLHDGLWDYEEFNKDLRIAFLKMLDDEYSTNFYWDKKNLPSIDLKLTPIKEFSHFMKPSKKV